MNRCFPTNASLRRISILLAMLFGFAVYANSETKSIDLHFNENEFNLTIDSHQYVDITSSTHTLILPSDSTKASIPYIPVSILMPIDAVYDDIDVQYQSVNVMTGVTLPPLPQSTFGLPDNEPVSNPIAKSNSNITSKSDIIRFSGFSNLKGYNIFHFMVRPFDYNGQTLSLNQNIDFNIVYHVDNSGEVIISKREVDLSKYVINPEDDDAYYKPARLISQSKADYDDFLEYAIITKRDFAEAFQPLIDWKNMKGIHTEIFFVEDIYAQYPDETSDQMKIKRFIYKLYKERDLTYVLLGGDNSVVPAQTAHSENDVRVDNKDERHKAEIPSDLFYASLSSPLDWDYNKNGVVGELEDRVDFSSAVCVARDPAYVPKAVENFVEKIINYERYPSSKNWGNDIVMSGRNMFESDGFQFCDGRGTEKRGDQIYEEYIKPYWDGKLLKLYDKYSDFNWKGFYPGSIKSVISEGHSFMNILTHGSDSYVTTQSADHLYGDELFYLNNPHPTILTSGACSICNLLAEDITFGTCVMLSKTNNIVSLYGATHNTIYRTNVNHLVIDGFPRFIGNFYSKMFTYKNDLNHIGIAFIDSKWDFIAACNDYEDPRWNMLTANLFGDPEMPVYTSVPKEFGSVKIDIKPDGSKFSVTVDALVDEYGIAVTKYDGNKYKILKSSYITSSYKPATFTTDDSTINICITKDGYIPYVIVFNPKSLTLQNEVYSDGCVFVSPIIKMGSNVTDQKGKGNVIFKGDSKGKYIIRAKNISIEAGTVFENGVQVKMDYTSF